MSHVLWMIPHNFDQWRKETNTLVGRTVCVARRHGTTLQLVRDERHWWTVTKFKGGKILAQVTVKKLPPAILEAVEAARPRRQTCSQSQ